MDLHGKSIEAPAAHLGHVFVRGLSCAADGALIFGDPKARIIPLKRGLKNDVRVLWSGKVRQVGRAGTHGYSWSWRCGVGLPQLRQGEEGAARFSGGQKGSFISGAPALAGILTSPH
jgi:hypothetical protein